MDIFEIGQALRKMRRTKRMSIQNCADKLQMSPATISRLEVGTSPGISLVLLLRYADLVGMTLICEPARQFTLEDAVEEQRQELVDSYKM